MPCRMPARAIPACSRIGFETSAARALRPSAGAEHHSRSCVALHSSCRRLSQHARIEVVMATKQQGRIVETATEARQAERGPSVLALLTVSTGLAVLILGIVWFVFFRT